MKRTSLLNSESISGIEQPILNVTFEMNDNSLRLSGIPVENSKGEAGIGQHELNVKYAEPLCMSDRHVVYKQCLKEVADAKACSVTFMAKPFTDATGSGCHVHLSLWHQDADGNTANAFVGDQDFDGVKCSDEFRWFLAGRPFL